jgi:HlyD family secretion protein
MGWKTGLAGLGIVLIGGGAAGAYYWYFREVTPIVTVETIKTRDLEALVSASGKIQPKRLVNISADTPGRVVDLAVNEGDRVAKGQFLLQIDPKLLRTRVQGGAAGLLAAEGALAQLQQSVETARVQLEQTQQNLARQRDLWQQQLTTREALQRAENDLRAAESTLQEREKQSASQSARVGQERAQLDSARYDLSKVRIESPIDGIVTRRNIQEGETAVIGTMNNAGTVLLTLADMSVIQAEVEVDETNIPSLVIGQPAKITVDALPDRVFRGHVTEIGNSPIQSSGAQGSQTTQATNFKVAVILDEPIPDVRPGFTCSADITTAKRAGSIGVPIPAVAVRELVYDANGQIVRTPRKEAKRPRWEWFWTRGRSVEPVASAAELEPGQTRKETEGVFTIRSGVVQFVPIKIGISGDKYFEVLTGLKAGDTVVTGPYNLVRGITDGDVVDVELVRR